MSEMVERVERALCKTGPHDPDEIGANGGPYWKRYEAQARAAIEAMREPTEAMGHAGDEAGHWSDHDADKVWQVMIDEALK